MESRFSTVFCYVAAVMWSAVSWLGFTILERFEATAGPAGVPSAHWPATTSLRPEAEVGNLVVLVHPHCPCSRLTLEELNEIMVRSNHRLTAHVLFYKPSDAPENWERTARWAQAASLPETHLYLDEDGQEAGRFGIQTSGHVLLYHPDGCLLFQGGITPSRGHRAPNWGERALREFLATGAVSQSVAPVFGCPVREVPFSAEPLRARNP